MGEATVIQSSSLDTPRKYPLAWFTQNPNAQTHILKTFSEGHYSRTGAGIESYDKYEAFCGRTEETTGADAGLETFDIEDEYGRVKPSDIEREHNYGALCKRCYKSYKEAGN